MEAEDSFSSNKSQTLSVTYNTCRTSTKVNTKHKLTWTIENFSSLIGKTGEHLDSTRFPEPKQVNEPSWKLRIYPKGVSPENEEYISVHIIPSRIYRYASEKKVDLLEYKISVLDSEHQKVYTREYTSKTSLPHFITDSNLPTPTYCVCALPKYIRRIDLSDSMLPDDSLTLFCEVTVYGGTVTSIAASSSFISELKVPPSHLIEDFSGLLESGKHSDLVFNFMGKKVIKAHKNILSARSAVFSAMFQHDTMEARENKVEIQDISYDVFLEMLKYIYTERPPCFENGATADELLVAADKYSLERLKVLCEENLCANIALENCADLLILADRVSAPQLRSHAVEFAVEKISLLKSIPSWNSMVKSNPVLFADIMYHALAVHVFSPEPESPEKTENQSTSMTNKRRRKT